MKKLTISRETLRNLSAEDLNKVVGGYPPLEIPVSDELDCGGGGTADCTRKSICYSCLGWYTCA